MIEINVEIIISRNKLLLFRLATIENGSYFGVGVGVGVMVGVMVGVAVGINVKVDTGVWVILGT